MDSVKNIERFFNCKNPKTAVKEARATFDQEVPDKSDYSQDFEGKMQLAREKKFAEWLFQKAWPL